MILLMNNTSRAIVEFEAIVNRVLRRTDVHLYVLAAPEPVDESIIPAAIVADMHRLYGA